MSSTALFRTEAEVARQKDRAKTGAVSVATSLGDIRLRITGDIQSLEALWEQLQASLPATASQTFDWAKAWERHVLRPEGREPVIVVGSTPRRSDLFLWPFEMSKSAGMQGAPLARPGALELQSGLVRAGGGGADRRRRFSSA